MFFPTPKVTEASSDEKTVDFSLTASTPFFNHVYRNGNVWWPENEGFVRYGVGVCSEIKKFPILLIVSYTLKKVNAYSRRFGIFFDIFWEIWYAFIIGFSSARLRGFSTLLSYRYLNKTLWMMCHALFFLFKFYSIAFDG